MLTRSDFMFTFSDFARIARAPEFVLTLAFAAIAFTYLSAASALA
jgi:hypothetical protein